MEESQTPEVSRSDLVITRVLDAPVEAVWEHWTVPTKFRQWWGSEGLAAASVKMDVRAGGTYLWCMRGAEDPTGPVACTTGEFTEVVPRQRLRFTARWADEQGKVLTAAEAGVPEMLDEFSETVTFEAQPDGRTVMTFTVHDLPVSLTFASLSVAMWQSLDRLEAALKER